MGRISDLFGAFRSESEPFCSAIIVAAGSGTRCDCGGKTKQMTELMGLPVVARTIMQFEQSELINEIIVVAKADEMSRYEEMSADYGWRKIACVVPGGETRQKSVFNGLREVSEKADFIAVHDGCRCLVTPEIIKKTYSEARIHGCASAACRAKDTIKREANGIIEETIDRSHVWMAQTPQIFKADILRAGAYIARDDGIDVTDDCMLAEYIGFKVKLVDCGYSNIKITTAEDMYIAEAIIRHRSDQFDLVKSSIIGEGSK